MNPESGNEDMVRKPEADAGALADVVGRIFPPYGTCTIERTASGASTQVYRIRRGGETYYLRIAESPAANLAPEAQIHATLHAAGVKVPAVIYFDPFEALLGRSILVTTEIAGEPATHQEVEGSMTRILREAGRDLALINSLPVQGFGWITRTPDRTAPLQAHYARFGDFVLAALEEDLRLLAQGTLTIEEAGALQRTIIFHEPWLQGDHAGLAHGDLDLTHIYHHRGAYSGIIDFGEIRGAHQLYDPGHFALHDGERAAAPLLPMLLAGYREVLPLSEDDERRIHLLSVLIGVRALAVQVRRSPPTAYQRYLAYAIRRGAALVTQ